MSLWLLAGWSALALVWWLVAITLVALASRRPASAPRAAPPAGTAPVITVFKCLAGGLESAELEWLGRCLESFVAELDAASELLLGVPVEDEAHWRAWARRIAERHPEADLRLVVEAAPQRLAANPKISWLRLLAPHARGGLWLWSDADIEAPAGTLAALRADFDRSHARGNEMVTSPYVVRGAERAPAMLDALYVNLEHYPGALLLGRLRRLRFGFGAGMLFTADAFRRRVDWQWLGECLADDYQLGQRLSPVQLGSTRLVTAPASERWRGALLHYHRWHKTVRWSAPGAFAAQALVIPAIGWLAAAVAWPGEPWTWLGLGSVAAMDSAAAAATCRLVGCRVPRRAWLALPAWSVIRALTWIACWLPTPILWRGKLWWAPRQSAPPPAPRAQAELSAPDPADTRCPRRVHRGADGT